MADYIALNPYLRRYDFKPEQQQQAYDRYVLANAQVGTGAGTTDADMRPNAVSSEINSPPPAPRDVQLAGADEPSPPAASDGAGNGTPPVSETPATDTSAEPDRRNLETIFGYPNYTPTPSAGLPRPAPNYTPMPGGFPARPIPDKPAKIDEARKAGYPAPQIVDFLAQSDPDIQVARVAGNKDEEILNQLAPPPSLGHRVMNGIGDAASAAGDAIQAGRDWLETRGNKAFGSAAGLPRTLAEISGIGWLAPGVMPYLPTAQDATNYIRRDGGIFPTRQNDGYWRAPIENRRPPARSLPPETNLAGVWGNIVDASVEGLLSTMLTGSPWTALTKLPNAPALMRGVATSLGSDAARWIARTHDPKNGTNSENRAPAFGYPFEFIP